MSLACRSCRRTSWSRQIMLSLSRAISRMQYPRNRFFTRLVKRIERDLFHGVRPSLKPTSTFDSGYF